MYSVMIRVPKFIVTAVLSLWCLTLRPDSQEHYCSKMHTFNYLTAFESEIKMQKKYAQHVYCVGEKKKKKDYFGHICAICGHNQELRIR